MTPDLSLLSGYAERMMPDTAQIEPYEGAGAYGPVYGDQFSTRCFKTWERQLVRDSDGNEVVVSGTLLVPVALEVPAESRVTIDGYTTTVMTSAPKRAYREVTLR